MVAKLPELAVAVVFPGKGHAVVTPSQQSAVFHQHRGMPGPCMGIPGQFRRPLYHLLCHMAVLTVERPPLGLLPWLHACHPFAAKTNPSPRAQRPTMPIRARESAGAARPPRGYGAGRGIGHGGGRVRRGGRTSGRVALGAEEAAFSRVSPCPPWTVGELLCHVW